MKLTKYLKKGMAVLLTATFCMGLSAGLTGCGKDTTKEDSKDIDTFRIMIAPYQDADTLLTGLEPLGGMIKDELATQGYNVGNVEITVGTSYSAVGEALSAGTADAGFISGGTYVTYDDDCDVLLTAQRKAINKDSLNARDWNDGTEEAFTDNLTTYYRSIILAGPSAKGQELAAKVNAGQKLTWDDLNGATWAVMGASSASGYIYPSLWLYNNYGKQISDLANVVQSDSYTTSMSRLAAGQVDVIVGFAHMRAKYAANWMSKFGGTDDCYKQTAVLAVTDQIMDDTICVSKNSDIMSEGFKKAFADACINIGKSEDGLKVLNVLSHIGYQYAQSSDYDAERAAQNMLKKLFTFKLSGRTIYMLQIDSVSKLYKGGDKALDNISFSVEQGEFISVIGKSGAGKTTLFRMLNGMIKPTTGSIIINNQDFAKLKGKKKRDIQKTIGTIYQDFCLVDTLTCFDNVLNGALAERNAFQALFGIFSKEQKEYAEKQLEAVGLSEKMYSYAGKLSGGQKQRVAIARALMSKPDIILADEPVASLDPYSAEQITDILVQLNKQYNMTVIMNSHSVELALKKSDRIIGIADGKLVLDKKSPEVTNEDIRFVYGGAYEKYE